MIKQTKFVPQIRKQVGNTCYSHTLAYLVEFLNAEKGQKVTIDPQEFHDRMIQKAKDEGRSEEISIAVALEEAKKVGLIDPNTKLFHKINYEYLWRKDIPQAIKEGKAIALMIDLETGEKFGDRLRKDFRAAKRLGGYHGVACIEVVDDRYAVIPNSWGDKWGNKGYFYLDLLRPKDVPIMSCYSITLL